jgi:23S rRNA (guanosine2251-2'-O)-methyltransferase
VKPLKRIITGPNAVGEALGASPGAVALICLAEGLVPTTAARIQDLARRHRIAVDVLPREQLDRLAKGATHQGVVALTGDYPYTDLGGLLDGLADRPAALLVVLDQVQDPGHLGAIVRSAHALGADGIVITRNRSAPVTAGAVRSSAGATELTRIARVTNLARAVEDLKAHGFRVLGAEAGAAQPVDRVDWHGRVALLLGNEARGLRRLTRDHCDALFSIPLERGFDSLGVSAAAAICLFEAARVRRITLPRP